MFFSRWFLKKVRWSRIPSKTQLQVQQMVHNKQHVDCIGKSSWRAYAQETEQLHWTLKLQDLFNIQS
ncbi:hypothetical protein CJ030_MR6G003657 [Morella rubra]|uniref:Uncharacterized protein n=1 Tax=Morella rubra TaxID=262757 RepID=A0A6A1V970_9ROSI|nr:hypothetical protein CJ030_MR6G003657 [Morella rubra]